MKEYYGPLGREMVDNSAFQLIGACLALDVVLTSTGTRQHWDDARAALAQPIPDERLRTVLDVLSAG
ncbi:hypothetical protein ABH940_003270 [Streptacidiphilus sp. BW17]|uniref:hypothetical protein n=1 Tax=unclassified Streptacidiphilus TaxID=2643834 RepID=UPI0035144C38